MPIKKLVFFRRYLSIQTDALSKYLDEANENIVRKQKDVERELTRILEKVNDADDAQELIEIFMDDNHVYYDDIPGYVNASGIIMVYSFFEANLKTICTHLKSDINANKPPATPITSIPGKYAKDAKDYLELTCGLALGRKKGVWNKLDKVRELRNFIAHSNLDLRHDSHSASKKKMVTYINRVIIKKSVTSKDSNRYRVVDSDLPSQALGLAQQYLNFVIDKGIKRCT